MSTIKNIAVCLSVIAASAGFLGCKPGRVDKQVACSKKSLDETRPGYSMEMQSSLTAYFKAHGMQKDKPLPPGLTIPWVSRGTNFGYLIATGATSEKGCPVFKAATIAINAESDYTARHTTLLAMCP